MVDVTRSCRCFFSLVTTTGGTAFFFKQVENKRSTKTKKRERERERGGKEHTVMLSETKHSAEKEKSLSSQTQGMRACGMNDPKHPARSSALYQKNPHRQGGEGKKEVE